MPKCWQAQYIHDHDLVPNGHTSLASNGLPLDFGGLNSSKHETLEQRLHDVIRQRVQLQRLEAELRAQFIARSEIIRVQNSFDEQTKQHASIVSNLQVLMFPTYSGTIVSKTQQTCMQGKFFYGCISTFFSIYF